MKILYILIAFTLLLPTLSHASRYDRRIQFSASQEEIDELNYRLNHSYVHIPSFYFRDPGSPYNPVSMFNMNYCANTPGDPACYENYGIYIETGY